MPRQARLDAPGTLHHVIVRGIEKRKIVSDNRDRENFVSRMGTIASETGTTIYAWALMINHAHIFLRSSPSGLPQYMRRLLTGYAVSYNRRHRRHGHLFQNRYKSIVCEEEPYFKQLVRYIHLNPLRAKLIESFSKLNNYRWCGHAIVLGRLTNDWQDRDYVLKCFGSKEAEAKKAYGEFIKKGINQGHRSDLVGGGLIRSVGGWSAVKAMRRLGVREKSDERILGGGEFVKQLIEQSDATRKEQFSILERLQQVALVIDEVCKKEKISVAALKSGSRQQNVSSVRSQLAKQLVEEYGLSLTETGRQIGVSPSAVAKSLRRHYRKSN
ncbi:MAG: transposase [Desulfobacterales bacterium]|jgi:REP element-mobilizing transposase RayT